VSPRLVIGTALFVVSVSLLLCSGFLMFAMIGEVNRKLPDQEQISYLGGHPGKYMTIIREYRRLYPEGRLTMYLWTSVLLGFALLAVSAVVFGFFG
jgi:hypothetical protein